MEAFSPWLHALVAPLVASDHDGLLVSDGNEDGNGEDRFGKEVRVFLLHCVATRVCMRGSVALRGLPVIWFFLEDLVVCCL